jgi:antitoxin VapB
MALHIRDKSTDIAVRKLARLKGETLTETIREFVGHEHVVTADETSLAQRLWAVQRQFIALKRNSGQPTDKSFFDELSGGL